MVSAPAPLQRGQGAEDKGRGSGGDLIRKFAKIFSYIFGKISLCGWS